MMEEQRDSFSPIRAPSLKDQFVERMEGLILSGELSVGERLPAERELAARMGVSRPVVHKGLMELAGKGLVRQKPRHGTLVNDYRQDGSIELLVSLLQYKEGAVAPELLASLLEMRLTVETEIAALAAERRTEENLRVLEEILERENLWESCVSFRIAADDYEFHHVLALASGNMIYPLMMNSFKGLYYNILQQFYQDPAVASPVRAAHQDLVDAVRRQDSDRAAQGMRRMLVDSAEKLEKILGEER